MSKIRDLLTVYVLQGKLQGCQSKADYLRFLQYPSAELDPTPSIISSQSMNLIICELLVKVWLLAVISIR